jgi:hypothetical protein
MAVAVDESLPTSPPPAGRGPRRWWILVAVVAVLLVPFVVLVLRAVAGEWFPPGDYAAIEMRTRAVGSSHTPLVGPYSRYGWHHPGPYLFYVLAVPYRLLGSKSTGILAGTALVNGVAVACVAWVLWRRGRVAGLLVGLLPLTLLMRALGGGFLEDPWNPYIVVLALYAVALLAWAVACGDHWMMPVAIVFASFAAQSHVGTALPAVAMLAVATMFLVVDARRDRVTKLRWLMVVSLAALVLLWLPAVVDQLRGGGGNLGALWRFWSSEHEPGPGFVNAARLVGAQVGVAPSFITATEHRNLFSSSLETSWTVPLLLALVVAATVWAARRHDRQSFALGLVALALTAASWVAAARIVGIPFTYLLRWTWVIGAVSCFAIAWTALQWLRRRRRVWRDVRLPVTAVATAVTLVLLTVVTVSAARTDPPVATESKLVHALDQPLVDALGETRGPVLVRPAGSFGSTVLATGIVMRLRHAGIAAGMDPSWEYIVGSDYVVAPDDAPVELVAVRPDEDLDGYANDPRYRELARYDSLSVRDRGELTALQERLAALGPQYPEWLETHPRDAHRLEQLQGRSTRAAIYEVR